MITGHAAVRATVPRIGIGIGAIALGGCTKTGTPRSSCVWDIPYAVSCARARGITVTRASVVVVEIPGRARVLQVVLLLLSSICGGAAAVEEVLDLRCG